ncbi:MAG: DUF3800 domain-containing protein [Deltaproteobacteria bacterium]|nr:DUF3800 domain-containing protein [Deltaproteobacteria bacterium]
MTTEYIIYADESESKGSFYSNFYGGALIRSKDLEYARSLLFKAKNQQNLYGEVKWQKVTSQYLDKYIALMDVFFSLVKDDFIKVRIMFTQNIYIPEGLGSYQFEHSYHLLYYQFIKHAFGLQFSNKSNVPITVRIYLDKLPDTKEKNSLFKAHLAGLGLSREFRQAKIRIKKDQIAEVSSHNHVIMQCLDVVLGAIQFRLNNKHKVKPVGAFRRRKRTIAKDKLYRKIVKRIREIYPNFNVGISTGIRGNMTNRWLHPYRHWSFRPKNFKLDGTKAKP